MEIIVKIQISILKHSIQDNPHKRSRDIYTFPTFQETGDSGLAEENIINKYKIFLKSRTNSPKVFRLPIETSVLVLEQMNKS